jgi:sugar lactone lactonase YvrE
MPFVHARKAHALACAAALLAASSSVIAAEVRTVEGLATPESVVVGPDGRLYVSEIGEFGKDGDGKISVMGKSGKPEPYAQGMDDPKGLAAAGGSLYVTDKNKIWKIEKQGRATVFVKPEAFPQPPMFLNDLVADSSGNLYVSDTGDIDKGGKGAIFKITRAGKVTLVTSEAKDPSIKSPNGLLVDGKDKLLVVDFATGELLRLDMAKGTTEKVAEGFGGGDGLARDAQGVLYISDWKNGRVWKLNRKQKDAKPEAYTQAFKASADITLSRDGKYVVVPDMKAGSVVWLPK